MFWILEVSKFSIRLLFDKMACFLNRMLSSRLKICAKGRRMRWALGNARKKLWSHGGWISTWKGFLHHSFWHWCALWSWWVYCRFVYFCTCFGPKCLTSFITRVFGVIWMFCIMLQHYPPIKKQWWKTSWKNSIKTIINSLSSNLDSDLNKNSGELTDLAQKIAAPISGPTYLIHPRPPGYLGLKSRCIPSPPKKNQP